MSVTFDDPGSGTLMFSEAHASGEAVERMLDSNALVVTRLGARLRQLRPRSVVTLARGSSDNACTYGRYLIENTIGAVCASVGLSAGSIYDAPATGTDLCVAVSQSGASPDLLAAVERAKRSGAVVVGLINQPDTPLHALCDEVISLEAAPEQSVAATKSFISSLAAMAWLVAEWSEDPILLEAIRRLPVALSLAWEHKWLAVENELREASNLFVLGRGPGLGVAQEAALKLKETCGLHAEALSAAEVVHGPMALIRSDFPVIMFTQQDESQATSMQVAKDLAGRGASLMLAGGAIAGSIALPFQNEHPSIQPILMAQSFYRAAANLSILRGFDPDRPPHLSKVTRTL